MENELENLSADLRYASMLADKLNETINAIQDTNSWHSISGVNPEGAIRKYANSPCNLYNPSDLNSDSRLKDMTNYFKEASQIAKQLEDVISRTPIQVIVKHL